MSRGIPRLSTKRRRGKFYCTCRVSGKPRYVPFHEDFKTSQIMYAEFVAQNYRIKGEFDPWEPGTSGLKTDGKLIRPTSPPVAPLAAVEMPQIGDTNPTPQLWTFGLLASAYLAHEQGRIRPVGSRRKRGLILPSSYDAMSGELLEMKRWMEQDPILKDRFRTEAFSDLFGENEYERMMSHYSDMSNSTVNKMVTRFWSLVDFARRKPMRVELEFTQKEVKRFGGSQRRAPDDIDWPTPKMLEKLDEVADPMEKAWLWMGLGLGFQNQDLGAARPIHFDDKSYDMRRGKNPAAPRFGQMPAIVWSSIQKYLKTRRTDPDDLLFRLTNGESVHWVKQKTPEEMAPDPETGKTPKHSTKKSNSVNRIWKRLKKRAGLKGWKERFNILRHLGATACGARTSSINEVRTFLGHGASEEAEYYMHALCPANRPAVEWLNRKLWPSGEGGVQDNGRASGSRARKGSTAK